MGSGLLTKMDGTPLRDEHRQTGSGLATSGPRNALWNRPLWEGKVLKKGNEVIRCLPDYNRHSSSLGKVLPTVSKFYPLSVCR